MQLTIQSINFDADEKLQGYVTKKTEKLSRFFDRITGGQVYLKISKPQSHNNKIVEIKLNVPGTTLIASEQADTFEAATDIVTDKLQVQLTRHKEKVKSH
ncbi:MAG: ribosome-associated translation inhibitor RaiA [Bacteroidia bacterium]